MLIIGNILLTDKALMPVPTKAARLLNLNPMLARSRLNLLQVTTGAMPKQPGRLPTMAQKVRLATLSLIVQTHEIIPSRVRPPAPWLNGILATSPPAHY